MLGGSLGFSSSPVIGGFIASRLDWRFAFIILAIPALIAAAILLFKFKERRLPEYTHAVTNEGNKNTKDVPTNDRAGKSKIKIVIDTLKPIGLLTILAILFQFVAGCAMAFIALYLVDKHGISTVYAAMWLGIIRGGGIAGSLLGGWLSDKWGRRNALTLVLVITGPILFMVTRLPFGVVLIAVMLLLGLTMNMRQSTLQPLLVAYTPPALMATVFGFYFGLSMEGSSMIQPVAGYFMDIIGINQVFDILAFIALGLSTVALLLWRKDKAAGQTREKV
jgi:FSR family fosmidomycin resistance protein-like MFS transporter